MELSLGWVLLVILCLIVGPLMAVKAVSSFRTKLPPGVRPLPPENEDDWGKPPGKPPNKE